MIRLKYDYNMNAIPDFVTMGHQWQDPTWS
jgi:hypothetical protein